MRFDHESGQSRGHVFDRGNASAERSTEAVVWITLFTMVLEIAAGWWYNSMALLADGWHMSSHVVAIGLSALAYRTARRYADDFRFAFGTWKIEVLAGFTSAVLLVVVAVFMLLASLERLVSPQPIHYEEALWVAVAGLLVNLVCAWILGRSGHHHGHDHNHTDHAVADHHHDLNLRSAYIHVLTDAATSLLAIAALVGGLLYGWGWLDAVMGVIGAVVVLLWAKGLLSETAKVLLDREMDHPVVDDIRVAVEGAAEGRVRIVNLHVWRVGRQVYACAMTVLSRDQGLTPDSVRQQLAEHSEIVHSTVEIRHLSADAWPP